MNPTSTTSGPDLPEGDEIPAPDVPPDDRGRNATSSNNSLAFSMFDSAELQTAAAAILAAAPRKPAPRLVSPDSEGSHTNKDHAGSASLEASTASIASSAPRKPSPARTPSTGDKHHAGTERHMWTAEETQVLVDGCNKHGIGNWKAILSDEEFAMRLPGRSAGDLKDRFRTYFPDAYHELYPNAKTHTSRAVRSTKPDGTSIFEKGKTKERRPFSAAEDEVLKRGYQQHGSHWATIAKNSIFEGRRKSTDLRDRFRNAFPELYEQAGYKPRAKSTLKKERRPSMTQPDTGLPGAAMLTDATREWTRGISAALAGVAQSDTSTSAASATSQCTSGEVSHSETSEGETSDAWERPVVSGSALVAQQLDLQHKHQQLLRQNKRSEQQRQQQSMSRSQSFEAPPAGSATPARPALSSHVSMPAANFAGVPKSAAAAKTPSAHSKAASAGAAGSKPPSSVGCTSAHGSLGRVSAHLNRPDTGLRRTQSSKRANPKISVFDGLPSTIALQQQQRHHQHVQQQRIQRQQQQAQQLQAMPQQQPQQLQQPASQYYPVAANMTRFPWETDERGVNGEMDLDAMVNNHTAAELLGSDASPSLDEPGSTADAMDVDEEDAQQREHPVSGSASASNAALSDASGATSSSDFSSLLGGVPDFSSFVSASPGKGLTVASFQDLLDPVGAPSMAGGGVGGGGWTAPWVPISSRSAAASATLAPTQTEHNHWAGDLLHRGGLTFEGGLDNAQLQQPSFVNLASMQLGQHLLQAGQQQQQQPSQQQQSTQNSQDVNASGTSQHHTPETGYPAPDDSASSVLGGSGRAPSEHSIASTPSVHELVSRTSASRRQGNSLRMAAQQLPDPGAGLMQSAYRNPYAYPVDDLHLTSLGSQTLFPSLVEQTHTHRRRRSTDTLRQNFSIAEMAVAFEPTPFGQQPLPEEEEGANDNGARAQRSESLSSGSAAQMQQSRLQQQAYNSAQGMPPRDFSAFDTSAFDALPGASSSANYSAPYAESLPDMPNTASTDPASFDDDVGDPFFRSGQLLQTSYDDLDLPLFLAGRSPAVAPAPFSPRAFAMSLELPTNWTHASGSGAPSHPSRTASDTLPGAGAANVRGAAKNWSQYAGGSSDLAPSSDARSAQEQQGASTAQRQRFENDVDAARWSLSPPSAGERFSTSTSANLDGAGLHSAGALDRLEHLYLEGLQPSASPSMQRAAAPWPGSAYASPRDQGGYDSA